MGLRTGKIRVLVVDDSALMRQKLGDILTSDPRIELAGTARDGRDALKQITALNPDVVTMDVEMPNMDGLTALETIMKTRPLPVIMVSSMTQEGAETTMKATMPRTIRSALPPRFSLCLSFAVILSQFEAHEHKGLPSGIS